MSVVGRRWPLGATILLLLVPAAPLSPQSTDPSGEQNVDDLLVCDCVVVKRKRFGRGRPPVLARQAPFRTTVEECKKRGGRYVLYSGADRKASLDIWLPAAEQGDPDAQYAVGEIHERGLGVPPDHAEAARWYRLAAEGGSRAAQNSLGNLYERGLGVERSPELALMWYRKAARRPEAIRLGTDPGGEQDPEGGPEPGLTEGPTIVLVEPPLIGSRGATVSPASADDIVGRVTAPAGLLQLMILGSATAVDEMGLFRAPMPGDVERVFVTAEDLRGTRSMVEFRISPDPDPGERASPGDRLPLGRYVAVVIGNSDYTAWPATPEAREGAEEMARILESRYGFLVRLLINASRVAVIRTLHELSKGLTEEDNLLIYYAGHGHLEGEWEDGFWLPVDAEPGRRDNWVPISEIIARANMVPARKTLVIADSAFRQMRSSSALPALDPSLTDEEREAWYREVAGERTLVALTSGEWTAEREVEGIEDAVFNRALAGVLLANRDVLETRRLRAEVAARMALASAGDFTEPECAGMRGHEGGDFLFVPE